MPDVPDFFSLNCVAGVLFSAFGFVVFTYGKRMRYWTPMLCGLALMLLPLFVADVALFVGSTVLGIAAVAGSRAPLERLFESILAEVESSIPGDILQHDIDYV